MATEMLQYPRNKIAYDETVDEFGGHSHDDYEYHYHAHSKTVEQQAGPNTYTFEQNYLQKGAFRGNINNIPGFFNVNTNQFMDSELKKYVGGTGFSCTCTPFGKQKSGN